MRTGERMSVLDLPFWAYGNTTERQQIPVVLHFDGAPSRELIRDRLRDALSAFPRLRQVVVETPARIARPLWRDVAVDVDDHFSDAELADDADVDDVLELLSRAQSQPFDPSRPMWRAWWCRLGDGSRVLAFVIHHACGDGITISDFVRFLSDDPAPHAAPAPTPIAGSTGSPSDAPEAAGGGLVDAARNFMVHLGRKRAAVWSGPLSQERRLAMAPLPLGELREVRRVHGVTLNDVVQTIVGIAVASILDEPKPPEVVFSMPLLVTDRDANASTGELTSNQVSLNLRVPVGLSPLETLREVSDRTAVLRDEVGDVRRMVAVASRMPRQAVMAVTRRKIRGANLISSNVPVDHAAVYDGVPIRRFAFWSPLAPSCPLAVTLSTTGDVVEFGFQWDPRLIPDASLLAAAFPQALHALQEASGAATPSAEPT